MRYDRQQDFYHHKKKEPRMQEEKTELKTEEGQKWKREREKELARDIYRNSSAEEQKEEEVYFCREAMARKSRIASSRNNKGKY